METNAATRAFGIEEVLENILFFYAYETGHVEPRTSLAKRMPQRLFKVRRVSRDFNNTIAGSKTLLRRLMFLEPTDTSKLDTKFPCHSPVQWLVGGVLHCAMHSHGRNYKEGGFHGAVSLSRLKDLAKRLRYLGDAWKRPEASWRKMLTCNALQGASSFTLDVKVKDGSHGAVTYKWEFKGQSKLSNVFDRFVELAEMAKVERLSSRDWERVDGLIENGWKGQNPKPSKPEELDLMTHRQYAKVKARQARGVFKRGEHRLVTYGEYLKSQQEAWLKQREASVRVTTATTYAAEEENGSLRSPSTAHKSRVHWME